MAWSWKGDEIASVVCVHCHSFLCKKIILSSDRVALSCDCIIHRIF